MSNQPIYPTLPLTWNVETWQNDHRWLQTIVRDTAPFSDAWTKARIIQLAHTSPPQSVSASPDSLPIYGGYDSEQKIAEALRGICHLSEYPDFAEKVNAEYVRRALNSWHDREFTKATGRNFDIYADRENPNVFLVLSTAKTTLNIPRPLPPLDQFRPLFNIAELGKILRNQPCHKISLRTHGYSTPLEVFVKIFMKEVESLNQPNQNGKTLEKEHIYIGFNWPSERPIFNWGSWVDYYHHLGIVAKFLGILGSLTLVIGTVLYLILALLGIPLIQSLGEWGQIIADAIMDVEWMGVVITVFFLWLLLIQVFRELVYQRDYYRAIHYGAPDLAEFFWRLDQYLNPAPQSVPLFPDPNLPPLNPRIPVNLIGHSMGASVVVHALRVLSDKFGKDDLKDQGKSEMGDFLTLDQLILTAPDIPLLFLQESRNNYVRSAILRCREIYLMSSDRDVVLRYLTTLGNWFIEPSVQMCGLRLGNIYLKSVPTIEGHHAMLPYVRVMIRSLPAVKPTSAYELFEKFNYLDCSQMAGVNQVQWSLTPRNSIPIDLVNAFFYLLGKVDVHGGYFKTNTPAFAVYQFLLTKGDQPAPETYAEIDKLLAGSGVQFLSNQMNQIKEQPATSSFPLKLFSGN